MDNLVLDYTAQPATSDKETIKPDPERVKDAFSRIGYSLAESIADLIDNSIDAKATDVLVRFLYDRNAVRRVFVVDNGRGMSEDVLRRAMRKSDYRSGDCASRVRSHDAAHGLPAGR